MNWVLLNVLILGILSTSCSSTKNKKSLHQKKHFTQQNKLRLKNLSLLPQTWALKKIFQGSVPLMESSPMLLTNFTKEWEILKNYYQQKKFRVMWAESPGISPLRLEWINTLKNAPSYGLRSKHYFLEELKILEKKVLINIDSPKLPQLLAELEILYSMSFNLFCQDYSLGRLNPKYYTPQNFLQFMTGGNFEKILSGLAPKFGAFKRIQKNLIHYLNLAPFDLPPVKNPKGLPWSKNISDDHIILRSPKNFEKFQKEIWEIKKKLSLLGDLEWSPSKIKEEFSQIPSEENKAKFKEIFDDNFVRSIKRFQSRHGLHVTGIIDQETLREINRPLSYRIDQLTVNLERWRWMPKDLGETFILVNIPNFNLTVMENKKSILEMKVIVGRDLRQTPSFGSFPSSITINPYWHVPPTLLVEDIIPRIIEDQNYLKDHNFKIYRMRTPGDSLLKEIKSREIDPAEIDFKSITKENLDKNLILRQDPGPFNPLGKMIFHLPNPYQVYLHDTSVPSKFLKKDRNLSGGCIRLEKPMLFAEFLLKDDPNWSKEKLLKQIDSKMTLRIPIKRKIPLFLVYWTSWINSKGSVHFRNDIYLWDKKILNYLKMHPSEKIIQQHLEQKSGTEIQLPLFLPQIFGN